MEKEKTKQMEISSRSISVNKTPIVDLQDDPIALFIDQCIDITRKTKDTIKSSVMQKAFIGNNNDPINQKTFKEYFIKKGINVKKSSTIDYIGVKFKSANILMNVMRHDVINDLIEQKFVIGKKIKIVEH